jgi:hypothetical protein
MLHEKAAGNGGFFYGIARERVPKKFPAEARESSVKYIYNWTG